MQLQSGTQHGQYEVVARIGGGGVAEVYRIRHTRLGSDHALKVPRLVAPSVVARLLAEGRAQGRLRHPNIVPVTDVVDIDGVPCLVMEWIDGPTLSQVLSQLRLDDGQADAVAQALFEGVAYAHAQGLVHRDLKPANVLMQRVGDRMQPRVADFGLVKALDPAITGQTRTGAFMGSPAYMAPEQSMDAATVDARADVFALSALLYEVLSGQLAFPGTDTWEVIGRIRRGDFAPLRPLTNAPQAWVDAVEGGLRPDPEARHGSVHALAAAWREAPAPVAWWPRLEAPTSPPPTSSRPSESTLTVGVDLAPASSLEGPPLAPRRRAPWPLAALALGAVAAWWAWPAPEVVSEPEPPTPLFDGLDDPSARRALEDGVAAMLQGQDGLALRRLSSATDAAPGHPLPYLVHGYALMRAGQTGASIAETREASRLATAGGPRTRSLLAAIEAQQRTGDLTPPAFEAHLEAWPRDALGWLMRADYCYVDGEAHCRETHARLMALLPDAQLAHVVVTETWSELGMPAEQRVAALAGLALLPDDPELLGQLSRAELSLGNEAAAIEALDRASHADPGAVTPRIRRLRLALVRGEGPLARRLQAALDSDLQPFSVRLRTLRQGAEALAGVGHVAEAEQWLARAEALSRADGSPTETLQVLDDRHVLAVQRGDWDGMLALADATTLLMSRSPEVADTARNRQASVYQSLVGRAALARGDVDAARAALARMRKAEETPAYALHNLERELAIAEGRTEDVRGFLTELWQGACRRHAVVGDALHRAGDDAGAIESYRAVLDASCDRDNRERQSRVLALVGLAELGVHDRDALIAEARALWPDADADLPLARRLAAL